MRILAVVCILVFAQACAFGLANNQLYVGDASTVAPGRTQLQLFTDTARPSSARLGGTQLRRGLTDNAELKLAYSYLWNNKGPNAQIGPNVGAKWRFAGDGLRKPSLAVAALYAVSKVSGAPSRQKGFGMTLVGSRSVRFAHVLLNYGRAWLSGNASDLRYIGLALVRPTSKHMLVALEYSDVERLGNSGPPAPGRQFAAGVIYSSASRWTYSAETGYLPDTATAKWHTTLGVSTTF